MFVHCRLDNVKINTTSCYGRDNGKCCTSVIPNVKAIPNINKLRIILRRKDVAGKSVRNLQIGKMKRAHLQWTSKAIQILEIQVR